MSEFPTLREANIARQKEWDTHGSLTLSFRGVELAGEVGEACNVMKKIERERLGLPGSRATLAQLAEELADIVITADLVALGEGIDLDAAVEAKFNATTDKMGFHTRHTRSGATPGTAAASVTPYSCASAGGPDAATVLPSGPKAAGQEEA